MPSLGEQHRIQNDFVDNAQHVGHNNENADSLANSMHSDEYKWHPEESREQNVGRIDNLIQGKGENTEEGFDTNFNAEQQESISNWKGEVGQFGEKLHSGNASAEDMSATLEELKGKMGEIDKLPPNKQEESLFRAVSNMEQGDHGRHWHEYKDMMN